MVVFGSILAFAIQGLNMQWPFVFKDTYGFSVMDLGWVFLAISLSALFGNWLSAYFAKLIGKEKEALILSQAITAIGIIIASSMAGLTIVTLGFLGHQVGRAMFIPLKKTYLNHRTPDEHRATVISFDSMVGKGGSMLGLLCSGALAEYGTIGMSWFVSGMVLAISVAVFLKIKNGE